MRDFFSLFCFSFHLQFFEVFELFFFLCLGILKDAVDTSPPKHLTATAAAVYLHRERTGQATVEEAQDWQEVFPAMPRKALRGRARRQAPGSPEAAQ